jgi:hypothetical protein
MKRNALALMVELLSQLPFYKVIFLHLIKRYSGQQEIAPTYSASDFDGIRLKLDP